MAAPPEGTIRLGDVAVRRMGFGAMRITGPGVWGPPADPANARRVLQRAVELGVNLIDTADAYGPEVSEDLIREALSPYQEDLVVATKGGLTRSGPGQWHPDGRPEHLRRACEASLKRLGVPRIDLYQFHRPDARVPFGDSIREIKRLQAEGKVRHVGLCNVTVAQLDEARAILPIVSVQNRYNLADRHSEDVLEACERLGIAFIPWFPLATGQLAHDARLAEVAQRHGATAAQVALAWLLQRSPVMLPIPGTASVAHLEENVGAAALRLSPDEARSLLPSSGR
ncbi:MAG: pyridoxine 4-dehydrogenase [Thermoplasmata archaeon]|jgi:aryl-alcohol dehydrogenase-like predicted oxidoreductase|nr:pyridoxine 4-dehydrogenase [Thermoplasmata archaeon]